MSTTKLSHDGNIIRTAIEAALKTEIEERYKKLKAKLTADLDRQKDAVLSGIVLHLMKQVDFRTIDERLVITVNTKPI